MAGISDVVLTAVLAFCFNTQTKSRNNYKDEKGKMVSLPNFSLWNPWQTSACLQDSDGKRLTIPAPENIGKHQDSVVWGSCDLVLIRFISRTWSSHSDNELRNKRMVLYLSFLVSIPSALAFTKKI